MSVENERMAFEGWLKKEEIFNGNDDNPDVIQAKKFMFKAWKASANREGYKLVPLEPSEEMYLAGFEAKQGGLNTIEIYRAMIGACDDH